MLTTHSVKIQSVAELTKSIRGLLETQFPFVTVVGEISNLRKPYSGHLYFTLKDSEAQIRAVLFKQQQRYLDINPANGLAVICRGRITLYEPRGEYQLLIDTIEAQGAGQLQIAFEKLKASLDAEGLFDQSAKQTLPFLPKKVSLITSPDGAAVHDFLKMADNRFPGLPVEIVPTRVQGDFAADEIVDALAMLNQRNDTDIIILCRGGGSLEDLWPFNEEKVARAIYTSQIPVVSAIGHEIDFTISDFVADLRAATPTAAAEAVIPDKLALREKIKRANNALGNSLLRVLDRYRLQVSTQERILGDPSILLSNFSLRLHNITIELGHALQTRLNFSRQKLEVQKNTLREANPGRILTSRKQRIVELGKLARLLISQKIGKEQDRLGKAAALLDAVSPLAVLGRGYSIALAKTSKQVIRDSHKLTIGDEVEVMLDSGSLDAEVTGIRHSK